MPGMFVMALVIGHFRLLTAWLVCFRMMFMSLLGDSLMRMVPVMFMIHNSHFWGVGPVQVNLQPLKVLTVIKLWVRFI